MKAQPTTNCPSVIPCSESAISKETMSVQFKQTVLDKSDKMIAIYVRKSSVDDQTQLNACIAMLGAYKNGFFAGCDYKVYEDLSSVPQRSQFNAMLDDIEANKISLLVLFDMIELFRSAKDYTKAVKVFKKHNVGLISVEDFLGIHDYTPDFMRNLVLSIAEEGMKRDRNRIKYAFYERAQRGLFLGGIAPTGFIKIPVKIDGVNGYMLAPNPTAVEFVRYVFDEYTKPDMSIGKIVREVNKNPSIFGLKKPVTNSSVRRMLRNPVYVRADVNVCRYLESKGAKFEGENISVFDGIKSCTIYGDRKNKTISKFSDMTGCFIQPNKHDGLIPAELWLTVQCKMDGKL